MGQYRTTCSDAPFLLCLRSKCWEIGQVLIHSSYASLELHIVHILHLFIYISYLFLNFLACVSEESLPWIRFCNPTYDNHHLWYIFIPQTLSLLPPLLLSHLREELISKEDNSARDVVLQRSPPERRIEVLKRWTDLLSSNCWCGCLAVRRGLRLQTDSAEC